MKKRRWTSWYPRAWRNRYGEEYEQLIEDLAAEQQLTWRTEVDIAQSGLALRRVYPARHRALAIGFALVLALGAFAIGFGVRGSSRSAVAVVGPLGSRTCIVYSSPIPIARVVPPSGAVQKAAQAAADAAKALRNALQHAASSASKQPSAKPVTIVGRPGNFTIHLAAPCGGVAVLPRVQLAPASSVVIPAYLVPPAATRQAT